MDREAIQEDHPQAWPDQTRWIDGLDSWIAGESGRCATQGMARLGPWKRATYSQFDAQSPACADLLPFNSIVRHVFFDTSIGRHPDDQENQLRCYTIALRPSSRFWFEGSDAQGGGGRALITDLRLYLSAQGTGILSIGVETGATDAAQALWINRRLRKLYPVDGESVRDGRTANWLALRLDEDGALETVCEEKFENAKMVGFYPPLPNTIKRLLYFADYAQEEYEPVLDENMLVYSYAELDAGGSSTAERDKEAEVATEFLFLRHVHGQAARFESRGETTLIGFTGHSCSLLHLTSGPAADPHQWDELCGDGGALQRDGRDLPRMFHRNLYLMVVIACFYRAVLLDFSERSALVARRLQMDQQAGRLSLASIRMVNEFRTEFLTFSGYWHFYDLSCKQADNDFFRRLCAEYRIDDMKSVLASELRHMTEFVYNFYQLRTTEAVNRLAMLSLIFGGGAVLTGFFGMNFGREFGQVLFEGEGVTSLVHYLLVAVVSSFVFGSLALGTFVVLRNWREYFAILSPPKRSPTSTSLKRER